MIGELGQYALILALMMALMGAIIPQIGASRSDARMMASADIFALGQFVMVSTAFGMLTWGFIVSDFSIRTVASNSHTMKPLLYKIAGVWGNHEGSLLLWVLILTIFGFAISLFGRKLPLRFRSRVLAVQASLAIGFLLFMLFTSNPFERLEIPPLEGNGLNPLLQDPGLAFHPPMLYLGYVGLSVAFSFAIAALIEGEVTPAWARWVRPWTLFAWVALTGGIALGSWWAYYELGWGGWWFWDPVENASFMPWLAATALLHSSIVVEKRDALKSWTILLAIVAFSFSLLGTFLVRSGVLTSVHAFAVDPARGIFILGFLVVVIGGSLVLYTWRAPSLKSGGMFGMVSRESALILNNVLLSTFAAVVLIGTLYPLILEALQGAQISVGPPFFNFAAMLLMAPLVIAMGFGPLLSWKRGKLGRASLILIPALVVSLTAALIVFWSVLKGPIMTSIGLMLAFWLITSVLLEISERISLFKNPTGAWSKFKRQPRGDWGMRLAHLGMAVVILGITVSEAWTHERLIVLSAGETTEVGGYNLLFSDIKPVVGPNYTSVSGTFEVTESGKLVTILHPESRLYTEPAMTTTEAAIYPMVSGDLYVVIGEQVGPDRWSMRLYFKPLISGLWFGAILMMLGGLISLSDRRLRIGAPLKKEIVP
jgi:cytochrome c-type biogenesis protein CcmF